MNTHSKMSIRIPTPLLDRLKQYCKLLESEVSHVSQNRVVISALTHYLNAEEAKTHVVVDRKT